MKDHDHVTGREQQIIALIALGYSNSEIGTILYISHETVKSHIRHALAKLHARSRSELVYRAIQYGILRVTPLPERPIALSQRSTNRHVEGWSGEPEELLRILTKD